MRRSVALVLVAGFLVPVVLAVGIKPEQNNQVSGIVNLMRNMGGSIGISAVTTLLARQTQKHQHDPVAHVYGSNPMVTSRVAALSHYLHMAGASRYAATQQAYAQLAHSTPVSAT